MGTRARVWWAEAACQLAHTTPPPQNAPVPSPFPTVDLMTPERLPLSICNFLFSVSSDDGRSRHGKDATSHLITTTVNDLCDLRTREWCRGQRRAHVHAHLISSRHGSLRFSCVLSSCFPLPSDPFHYTNVYVCTHGVKVGLCVGFPVRCIFCPTAILRLGAPPS